MNRRSAASPASHSRSAAMRKAKAPFTNLMRHAIVAACLALSACATPIAQPREDHTPSSFTIAVLPDTQSYVDYRYQTEAGFAFDAREMFFEQMRYVESRLKSNGGDIAFVTSVGDVWEHATDDFDESHRQYGLKPPTRSLNHPAEQVRTVEMPAARQGYEIIAGKTPFSVVPGNHDYDAAWPIEDGNDDAPWHIAGFRNFNSVFGADTPFFKDKPWYIASYNGGADSAQIFEAGGYRFLHIGLEWEPTDDVLDWASSVIAANPGLPTIVSIHKYLARGGAHAPTAMALPGHQHNGPDLMWSKFVSRHDQIFLVLSGHFCEHAYRIDKNAAGQEVHQVMADYQCRKQAEIDAGVSEPEGVGDGWLRLMTFNFESKTPEVRVRTYSTHYKAYASELEQYADWYNFHPNLTDAEFLGRDEFAIKLADFRERFDGDHRLSASPPASKFESVAERFARTEPVVIAHRGCWRDGPENSLAALNACAKLGVDMVEIDLRQTGDGVIVIVHDKTLDRTTDLSGPLADRTWADLSKAHLRQGLGGPDTPLTDQRVLTFEQMLEAAIAADVQLFLDIKEPLHDQAFAIVQKHHAEDRVLFSMNRNFGPEIRDAAFIGKAAVMPKLSQYLNGDCTADDPSADLAAYASLDAVAYEAVFCDDTFIDRVMSAPDAPAELWVNALGPGYMGGRDEETALHDPEAVWGQLLAKGVTAIQTDHPKELIDFLKARDAK